MTNQQHPITPPLELILQWNQNAIGTHFPPYGYSEYIATQAARWGADQELEACVEWVINTRAYDMTPGSLRAARRRPKPLSLKEQALAVIENSAICDHLSPEHAAILRRALEALDD